MKIETKYNIGDIVYYPEYNKVKQGKIITVDIKFRSTEDKNLKNCREINYGVLGTDMLDRIPTMRNEYGLYTNREDAVKLLVDQKMREIPYYNFDVLTAFQKTLDDYIKKHPKYNET